MKYLFVACLLCLSVLSAVAKVPAMNKIRLTNNWEYLKGDLGGNLGGCTSCRTRQFGGGSHLAACYVTSLF